MTKKPKTIATSNAPAMPPRNPSATLFVSCAARTAVIAATSIIPSMPRLMIPLRCTTSSPCTARSSGVAARIASGRALMTRSRSSIFEPNEHEDHDRLTQRRDAGGDVGGALQLARARDERAEEKCRADCRERVKLREQRDGDA